MNFALADLPRSATAPDVCASRGQPLLRDRGPRVPGRRRRTKWSGPI